MQQPSEMKLCEVAVVKAQLAAANEIMAQLRAREAMRDGYSKVSSTREQGSDAEEVFAEDAQGILVEDDNSEASSVAGAWDEYVLDQQEKPSYAKSQC